MSDDNKKLLPLASLLLQGQHLPEIQEVFKDLFDNDSSKTIIDVESESCRESDGMIGYGGKAMTYFNPHFGMGVRNNRPKKRRVSQNLLDRRKKQSAQKKARKITKKN